MGNLDRRIDLDEKIKANDNKYKGSLSVMASKLSYENGNFIENVVRNHWKVSLTNDKIKLTNEA